MLTLRTNWTFPACPTHARGLTEQAEVEADRAEERGEPVPCRALARRRPRSRLVRGATLAITIGGVEVRMSGDLVFDWTFNEASASDGSQALRGSLTVLPAPTPTPLPE